MRGKRWIAFYIAIVIGIAAGLAYGWLINPPRVANTSLQTLRSDYRADYVLMAAEGYAGDADISKAMSALRQLTPTDPLGEVRQALVSAQQLGYSTTELQFIANLEIGLTKFLVPGGAE